MLSRNSLKLKWVRWIYFPFQIVVELTLAILFLTCPFHKISTNDIVPGYSTIFGNVLFVISIIVFSGILLLFLTSFKYRNIKLDAFFSSIKIAKIIAFITLFIFFVKIVLLSITQLYYTLFVSDVTPLYLIILFLSILLPIPFYFIANFDPTSQTIYALSKEAPIRIRVTAFWLVFLTAAMQLFSTQWEFVIIGVLILITAYLFFYLYRSAVVITPSILLIHFTFSAFFSIISLIHLEETIQNLISSGENITKPQAILILIVIFIIPGLISLLLAQSFFRKWVFEWIKTVKPEPEMAIKLEIAD